MENIGSIREGHLQAVNLLFDGRMKDALELLASMIETGGGYQLLDEIHNLQTSYHYMLQYMEQGMDDPERDQLFKDLRVKALNLANQIELSLLDEAENTEYHRLRKRLRQHPLPQDMTSLLSILETYDDAISLYEQTLDEQKLIDDMLTHEAAIRDMFKLTWTNSRWTTADKNIAYKYLSSELLPPNALSMLVSAVTLSLFLCFDIEKVHWLMEAFYHKDTQVRVRAQVGFLCVISLNSQYTSFYPSIQSRLSMMQEEIPHFASEMNATLMQLIWSQATERINKTMQEEIVPEVMKNIQKRTQHPTAEEIEEMEMNPDWLFDQDPKLHNKMNKIAELQNEGGDINMVPFSRLKSFTFFNELQNWLYPFYTMHSEVIKTLGAHPEGKHKMEMNFLKLGMFCDSDCYSMVMLMQQLPPGSANGAFSGLPKEHMEEILNNGGMEEYTMRAQTATSIRRSYVQNLYRFFKLSPFRAEFINIFENNLNLNEDELFKPILYHPEFMRSIADLLFKLENYEKAAYEYHQLVQMQEDGNDIYQKLGFCHAFLKNYQEAINCYQRALLISPANKWTLRHLAMCYRHIEDAHHEESCYKELVEIAPDNLSYTYGLGRSLMEQEKYEEALPYFYKIDVIDENNIKAWRGIGWCCFILDKLEQAQKYYDKLTTSSKPDINDWLNAGHVAWCQGHIQQALQYYKKGAEAGAMGKTIPNPFYDMFKKDFDIMQKKGFSETDLLLMRELV